MMQTFSHMPGSPGSDGSYEFQGTGKLKGANYRRPGTIRGYTGHIPPQQEEPHILESPSKKQMIRGYTGFRPNTREKIGIPLIPGSEEQSSFLSNTSTGMLPKKLSIDEVEYSGVKAFRMYAKHMDIIERYSDAVKAIMERGQSQALLLRIVQAKMSERVQSYSDQVIRTRKMFEGFDFNYDGSIDENEFRMCLEKMNIQFDDMQSLALFAYFDDNNDGWVVSIYHRLSIQ